MIDRTTGLGASDIATALGLNPWRSPLSLWMEKRGLTQGQPENERMRLGTALEPVIAAAYERAEGVETVETTPWTSHPVHDWARCSPDRLVAGQRVGLECKATGRWSKDWGDAGTDQVPFYYLTQVAWCMFVMDYPEWHLCALCNLEIRIYRIMRDRRLEQALYDKAQAFWESVLSGEPPPATAQDTALLSMLHPQRSDDVVDARELDGVASDLARIERDLAACAEERARLQAQIKERIGAADAAEGTNWRATWRTDKNEKRVFRFYWEGDE